MNSYRKNPDAVRALVQPEQVHRDLYINEELFQLEQEHYFANTWNYVGHDSQIPNAGDFLTNDIAGQPLIIVRQKNGDIKAMKNRCAHKGCQLVSAECGNTGKFFRCPYHAWTYKTDGSLLSVPLKNGYEGTGLDESQAKQGLTKVPNVRVYRGFIFVKLSDSGLDFEEYFGDSLSSIDNMVDRSPEGELEVAGGCLKYIHECNWKMFVENLNDTMHPMVTHEASAGTAREVWAETAGDQPAPMAVEILAPFMSDYKFFEDSGIRAYRHGHSYDGVHGSIHSGYSGMPEYDKAMIAAHGEERAKEILGDSRHNTAYLPNLTIKGAIQAIRVAKPISADRTIIESWTFRPKGAPDELLQRNVLYTRLINGPFSMVGNDDLHNYRQIQKGLYASGNEWISLHRNYDPNEGQADEETVIGTSELPMRGLYRSWLEHMVMTMEEDSK